MNNLQPHEYANIFPMMTANEMRSLLDDMKANGYDKAAPIMLYEGKILDGRNRYAAASQLGIEPTFADYQGDNPVFFAVRHNLNRRHLTEGQRAAVAAKLANLNVGGNGANQYNSNSANLRNCYLPELAAPAEAKISQADAASMLNVSERSVSTVKAVEKAAPELVDKILSGEITPHAAYQQVKVTRDEAAKMAGVSAKDMAKIDHIEKVAPELMMKLESGEMTLGKAEKEVKAIERDENIKQRTITNPTQRKAKITLICGKAESIPDIADNSIDLIITSPPYNFGGEFWPMGGNGRKPRDEGIGYADDMPYPEYFDWQIEVLQEMYRVAKDGASMFYNHKVRQMDGGIIHPLEWLMRDDHQWTIRQEIIWDRKSTHNHVPSLFWQHDERIYWLTKGKPIIPNQPIGLPSIWSEFGPVPNQTDHPAPFTPKLPRMILEIFRQPNMTVLDPFVGSGTVIDVCNEMGINSIGVDISAEYIKKVVVRYE